jgi:hypothetical protein
VSAYGYVAPKLAVYERICSVHETPLLEQRCAYPHGATYTCPRWYLVREGKVEAECTADNVRWLRDTADQETKLTGLRVVKIRQRKPSRPKMPPSVARERRRLENARRRERVRAAREGREPEAWAVLVGPTRKPALQAPAKRTA